MFSLKVTELIGPPLSMPLAYSPPGSSEPSIVDRTGSRNNRVPVAADAADVRGLEGGTVQVAAHRARSFGLMAAERGLSAEVMEQIYEDVRRLAGVYPRQPLTEILGSLVTVQDTLFTLLESRQKPADARDLYFLAAATGGMLAKASHDLADPHAAMTQARTAYICAEQADHNGLRGWIRGLQSLIAYWASRPRESLRYAQSGNPFATVSGGTTGVLLPLSEARAWAALGNSVEALSAVRRAESARDRVGADELDEFGGLCTFGKTRQLYYSADALAWLPSEASAAAEYSARAVEAYSDTSGPEWAFGDQAGSHADLAIARIAQGEIEGATDALVPVLGLPPEQRINGVIGSTRRVHSALLRSELGRGQRELQEAIEAFCRTPVAALSR